MPEGERLQKVLARRGFGSRRACEELVTAGRVRVNRQPARLGQRVDPERDVVEVDGVPVGVRPGLVYYLLNKPRGVVTTASDPQGRPTVTALVPPEPRVFPVGRLDADSEGLLLLTNDGELAHRLAHPRYGVEKVYEVDVEGVPSEEALRRLAEGVELEDGRTAPAGVRRLGAAKLELTLHEGRKHQVKRMCEAVGHPVRRLHRSRYAGLTVDDVPSGRWRALARDEVEALRRNVGLAR